MTCRDKCWPCCLAASPPPLAYPAGANGLKLVCLDKTAASCRFIRQEHEFHRPGVPTDVGVVDGRTLDVLCAEASPWVPSVYDRLGNFGCFRKPPSLPRWFSGFYTTISPSRRRLLPADRCLRSSYRGEQRFSAACARSMT